ncbi:MAG: dTMP kinase, partial [Nitrospiraceae bacterium]|nr:dTMP kinase [Nitrospiraceae bacterium]
RQNRLDRETQRFHERVRQGFLDLYTRHPRRIRLLDARADPDSVTEKVAVMVNDFLATHPLRH